MLIALMLSINKALINMTFTHSWPNWSSFSWMGKIHSSKSLNTLHNLRLLLLTLRQTLYKYPHVFIKVVFNHFSYPTEKKVALLYNLHARQAGIFIHSWTKEIHTARKQNFYKLLHEGDPKPNLLLAFIACFYCFQRTGNLCTWQYFSTNGNQ